MKIRDRHLCRTLIFISIKEWTVINDSFCSEMRLANEICKISLIYYPLVIAKPIVQRGYLLEMI